MWITLSALISNFGNVVPQRGGAEGDLGALNETFHREVVEGAVEEPESPTADDPHPYAAEVVQPVSDDHVAEIGVAEKPGADVGALVEGVSKEIRVAAPPTSATRAEVATPPSLWVQPDGPLATDQGPLKIEAPMGRREPVEQPVSLRSVPPSPGLVAAPPNPSDGPRIIEPRPIEAAPPPPPVSVPSQEAPRTTLPREAANDRGFSSGSEKPPQAFPIPGDAALPPGRTGMDRVSEVRRPVEGAGSMRVDGPNPLVGSEHRMPARRAGDADVVRSVSAPAPQPLPPQGQLQGDTRDPVVPTISALDDERVLPALGQSVPARAPEQAEAETASARMRSEQSDVFAQIRKSIPTGVAATIGSVEVELSPPELGRVRIAFTGGVEGGLSATLSVERPETLDLVRRHIGLLADDLRAMGYSSLSLDVGADAASRDRREAPAHGGMVSFDASDGAERPESLAPEIHTATPRGTLDLRM